MELKKVLIITYYWPPSGGGGVQRWVKFTKYLREFGWDPVVYVPDNADYPIEDKTLEKDIPKGVEILKQKIWEPYSYYSMLLGNKKSEKVSVGFISSKKKKKSLLAGLALWVRGNLFIPDARKFWVKPSVKYLSKYLQENGIDTIITTGPPHSMHLIGLKLKENLNINWLADFRDPWVHMDNNIEDLRYTKRTLKKHLKLEKEVLTKADTVVTVTQQIVEDYIGIRNDTIDIITNGFDSEDFDLDRMKSDKFIIGHYGTFGKYRNPVTLFQVLKDICIDDPEFKAKLVIELIGPVDASIFQEIERKGLINNLERKDYVPHKESIKKMINATILLLLLDKNVTMKGRMTGKIFEYLAARRPILGQGSLDSDPVKLLSETEAGRMIEYDDYEGIKFFILEQYDLFNNNEEYIKDTSKINKYSRRELTKNLALLLDKIHLK